MMSGKKTVIFILGFCFCFCGLFFYFQTYAYYQEVYGVKSILVNEKKIKVWNYQGIKANTSALKMRSCFNSKPSEFVTLYPAKNAKPLSAPFWFSCFNSKKLQIAIDKGIIVAYLAVENEKPGIDRFVTIFPGGNGYEWRQLNERYLD